MKGGPRRAGRPFGAVDYAMAAYGVCVVLSVLCSDYGQLAWTGYPGWYMGAVSQLLFVGIYFFVSRQYDGTKWPLYAGEAALLAVTFLGLLQGWNSGDWEYSHMLSTLGNINWLCGYYSVMLAFLMTHYLEEERRLSGILLYGMTVSVFVLLGIQGSQGGLLILATCVAVCLYLGRRNSVTLRKVFLVLAGFFAGMPLMGWLMKLRAEKAAVVKDGNIFAVVKWYAWPVCMTGCLLIWILLRRAGNSDNGARKRGRLIAGMLFACGGAAVLWFSVFLFQKGFDDSFGNGRGYLWRIAVESFQEADWKDLVLGAGPDCFGEAVFLKQEGTNVWDGDHWQGAVFTNAHNEALSQLCNVGILGTASYLAIFLTAWRRYGGAHLSQTKERTFCTVSWLGPLAIAMYGMHSLISFQQVLSTPLLFLALGVCERRVRRQEKALQGAIAEL